MDNLISGSIAVIIFIAFTAGLAETIDTVPFYIIVGSVIVMALVDFLQSAKAGLKEEETSRERD
ncbi:MAG: hypothetical protein HOK06_07720 [Rhodospirillaceae bacterium]|jgi:hypothetical protein|nr:hypothetical protein [Rhodospirillaceae bacterium]MBT4220299.1 hypothetical protein [Rhodospirillaceae bacterium]MBT5013885.1 hypothetical protein [Rhodospirillaceae bacterium]MBT6407476.1 hypothetical protein [Rhodospirillaceae bacterium]MBT7354793.1 hypothetical protein [Rhodospirillaceae bacterium]